MSEEPRLDNQFYAHRAARVKKQVCRDGLTRGCYQPYFPGARNCVDCVSFEIAPLKETSTRLLTWCRKGCPTQPPEEIDPTKLGALPKTCSAYQLFLITADYAVNVPKGEPNGGLREQSPVEFCKNYAKEVRN